MFVYSYKIECKFRDCYLTPEIMLALARNYKTAQINDLVIKVESYKDF